MTTYTKEINRKLRISESESAGRPVVMLVQANPATAADSTATDDIIVMNDEEALAVYQFLHRVFNG
ncbi:hypothetical protein ACQUFY_05895 [Robbsia andropogonis]|uniref:hypothetical protein n=1 Tax=Robbsia andropogonis TaxID=28092 RepID=UPI003D19452D